jgi:hypothetical protein
MRLTVLKRSAAVFAATATLAIAGLSGEAGAFSFTDGDLVLAIYGGGTEALYNLGNANTALSTGINNMDVSSGLTAVSGSLGTGQVVKYTIFGAHDLGGGANQVFGGTPTSPGSINSAQLAFSGQFEATGTWLLNGTSFTGNTITKTDTKSFSFNLGDPTDNLIGSWPAPMRGAVDQSINLLRGDTSLAGLQSFTQVGTAILTAGGLFSLSAGQVGAVPLPAAVVLFGTGLIGLVGIARRSFNQLAA